MFIIESERCNCVQCYSPPPSAVSGLCSVTLSRVTIYSTDLTKVVPSHYEVHENYLRVYLCFQCVALTEKMVYHILLRRTDPDGFLQVTVCCFWE